MNRFLKTVVLTTLVAGVTLAQGPFGGRPGAPPDPATQVAEHVARLTTLLDLTTAQTAQATSIFTTAQTGSAALQTRLETDHTALETAVKGNATATIDQL